MQIFILLQVERIIACRLATDGRISYLVRWKGYKADDDTWEPEENLHGCKQLIVKFFKERDVNPVREVRIFIYFSSSLAYFSTSPANVLTFLGFYDI